eukprot:TRINITY_DN15062_c0_g1_i1.p1 TRINITY_DN15062_c0_g1~~TRINITY_DN15062_c0_g1_i1.p1  ORF type:complete len:327 (+),score=58.00 TRINITY_DN15062_c0_g1_i1:65-1045(+)
MSKVPSNVRSRSAVDQGAEVFDNLKQKVPPKFANFAEKVRPVVMVILQGVDLILPYLPLIWDICQKLYILLLPCFEELTIVWGFVLAFFGGSFVTTITAVEAFRLVGKKKITESWARISDDVDRVISDYNKSTDTNITANEWLKANGRRVLTHVDPDDCKAAMLGFYAGITAIVACLKSQFAKCIALGASMGDVIESHCGVQFVTPVVKQLLPEDHHKWAPFATQCICRLPAVFFSWFIQRLVAAFHSSVRGGSILADALIETLMKRGLLTSPVAPQHRSALASVIAGTGLLFQLNYGFTLPWFLAIFLFPFTIIENILYWTLSLI